LKKRGIKHEVLNAKYHEKEAEIIAQAGKKNAVTIATNMAGRGTDIVLGGNAEHLAKNALRKEGFSEELILESTGHAETADADIIKVRERYNALENEFKKSISLEAADVCTAGGLFIIGTERHESRRIDNQLRGRSGRQGDPGASRFFISLEDDLMRLFGGDRVQGIMDTLHVDEDTPIENKMITNVIESAQKKLEARNFSIRKNVLQFDDVMNSQREIIYGQRNKVLQGEDVSESVRTMVHDSITDNATLYLGGDIADDWDFTGLRAHYLGWLTRDDDFHYAPDALGELTRENVIEILTNRAADICKAKEAKYGSLLMREIERNVLLRNVDTKWMEHIDAMDELRKGIYLRSYGQHDPVVEYRIEGFNMFDAMVESIREDTTRMLLTIELKQNQNLEREQVAKPTGESGSSDGSTKKQPVKKGVKIGRNDPCPCGSGLKWKKCTCEKYHS
ncbi:MAG: SEC-C metal-binding domain-containing protein, partial [Ruthenibacterium sp.]